jgi:hypothetical protein
MTEWTTDQLTSVAEMAAQGASAQRIAAKTGRSIASVKLRARLLGFKLKSKGELRNSYGVDPHWNNSRLDYGHGTKRYG